MSTDGSKSKPARERAAEKGLQVIGATALKLKEPEHGDGDDGGDDDKLTTGDRLEIMQLAATCYAAVHQGDAEEYGTPTPQFEHPVKLAEAMRAWIEDGKTL